MEPSKPGTATEYDVEPDEDTAVVAPQSAGKETYKRVLKSTTTEKHSYIYARGKLLRETITGNGAAKILDFRYDQSGAPYSLTYTVGSTSTVYYYVTNLQGDVMYLVDSSGNQVAAYTYDPYGKVLTATGTMAEINPLRYRGYYQDIETGFYYLQSRYYDPAICRFINADSYASTGQGLLDYNMFAYCGNNPVNRADPSGRSWIGWLAAAAIVVAAAVVVVATAGTAAGAIVAVATVANGAAVASTATTVAAGVFIGASAGLAVSTLVASEASNSLDEFANYGSTAFALTATGGVIGGVSAYGISGHNCFVAGTEVLTENGIKAIETIEQGDLVWAWDEETGDVALKEVVETYVNETEELVHIWADGQEIVTTPSHPFYSPIKGWTDAVDLRAGDILVLVNGEYVVVEQVQHELLEAPILVYNFQVADYHTYYVASGVLVHNRCQRLTEDQQALSDLANDANNSAKKGKFISYAEAQILDEWAYEYNVPQHHQAYIGSGAHWTTGWDHTHIFKIHVPFGDY